MQRSPRVSLAVVLALLALAVAPTSSVAAPADDAEVQLIVSARHVAAAAALDHLETSMDVATPHHLPGSRLTTVSVPAADADRALELLNADPRVEYAERDAWLQAAATPGDPDYPQQWGPAVTGVDKVWDTTTGSSSIRVAVIDSGVDQSHPDFAGVTFVQGRNFVAGDSPSNTHDNYGHGTAVTGVIAAQHNSIGTAGVCPRCAIMPLKALNSTGGGSHAGVAAAIDYAVANGARIVNISVSGTGSGTTDTLPKAIAAARDAGVLVFAAAGGAGTTQVQYPAGFDGALGVAGSDANDDRYGWSSHGSWVVFAAPGCVYGPKLGGGYGQSCGTSYSAPFAAGIAGLLASTSAAPSRATLDQTLRSTAKPVSYVAAGRIDAAAALSALTGGSGGGTTPTPSPTPSPGGGGGGATPTPTPSPTASPGGGFDAPVTREASAGETVHTDGAGTPASAERPLQVAVTTPAAGTVSIRRSVAPTTAPPDGYRLLAVESVVQAPPASASSPLTLQFRVHASLLGERDGFATQVLRNGRVVPACSGDGAAPDPCLASMAQVGSDFVLGVRTTQASTWSFAVATAACPGGAGKPPFGDVSAANAHGTAIACAVELAIARGVDATRYAPARSVTRGQMATFIGNMLAAAGAQLPAGRDAFSDDDGHAHESAINRLAAAGVVSGVGQGRYAPSAPVSREQMATFLVRAYEYLAKRALPAGGDAFGDDDGRAHEASINKAAAAGFASGSSATTFSPTAAVRRDQMASFLVRVLDKAVVEGLVPGR